MTDPASGGAKMTTPDGLENEDDRKALTDIVARLMLRNYCPLSWPAAWDGASEQSRDGWRRSAKAILATIDACLKKKPRWGDK